MKKILVAALITLSFAGTAFAASVATNTKFGPAVGLYGGVDSTSASAASNPLVKLSTGVEGLVNFDNTTHTSYSIVTKHTSGSKYFGTANDSTNIYWKQDVTGELDPAKAGSAIDNSNFTAAAGWTAY